MHAFVATAAALALLAAAFVLGGARARRSGAVDQRAVTLALLRARRAELEREHAAGALSAAQCAAALDELDRRVLDEAAESTVRVDGAVRARGLVVAAAVAVPLLAAAIYAGIGRPQFIGWNAVASAGEADAAAQQHALLAAHVAAQPGDARAWVLLARAQMAGDVFVEAADSYRRALDASPKVARDPQVWCEYADALGMAQGSLAGAPAAAIERALALDPLHLRALEMAGSAAVERRDWQAALAHWRALLARLPDGSTERQQLARAVDRVQVLAAAAD